MPFSREEMSAKRDRKVTAALKDLAPIWLVNDEYRPREDSMVFNVVYLNPVIGWVNHRYKYDAFNNVLYHMGTMRLKEEETLPIQEQEPYIPGEVATRVPVNPAHRLSPPLPGSPRS